MNTVSNSPEVSTSTHIERLTGQWFEASVKNRYSYNFTWLGRPVIQYPQDLVAMQEIIWEVQPDLIIETGIAHGGSLIFSASMLELNAICGGPHDAVVLGIDIDIREHNKIALEAHPLFHRILMIEGSSTDQRVIDQVVSTSIDKKRVMVLLDSNHTHAHVLAELQAYAHLTSIGSYCVVFDTAIDNLPSDAHEDRPWGPSDNPLTALREFLKVNPNFVSDQAIDRKLLISVAPEGYLRRIN